jgi:hypothetical protein
MNRPQRSRELAIALTASLISIIVTLLSVLITVVESNNTRYAVPALYFFLAAALACLAAVYLFVFLHDLRTTQRDLDHATLLERTSPTFVTFRRRVDEFLLYPHGRASLTWDFELASDLGESLTELSFPIIAELVPDRQSPLAVVELLEMNGEEQDIADAYRIVERYAPLTPMDESLPKVVTEHGLLRVPISLPNGRATCRVRVRMRFEQLYQPPFERAWLLVDIPYVTEQLIVTISAPGRFVRRDLREGGTTITATSALMDTVDPVDTRRQSQLCRQAGASVVWDSPSAKIGYRYRVYFRLEEQA